MPHLHGRARPGGVLRAHGPSDRGDAATDDARRDTLEDLIEANRLRGVEPEWNTGMPRHYRDAGTPWKIEADATHRLAAAGAPALDCAQEARDRETVGEEPRRAEESSAEELGHAERTGDAAMPNRLRAPHPEETDASPDSGDPRPADRPDAA